MLKPDKTLVVVVGPTAIGKTDLAIKLAQHYQTDIISADSRQFFKEMSIGTAKPSDQDQQAVKHHFIDSHSIASPFSVGDFEKESILLLEELFDKHDTAILVGGSGLYIQAICEGFDDIPSATDEVRSKWNNILAAEGIGALQNALFTVDLEYYQEVDTNNPQRLIRALEVYETTGKPFSSYRIKKVKTRPFHIVKIGLEIRRDELYKRIDHRVDMMLKAGLLEEVRSLLPHRNLNALNTVGYSEFFAYLDGIITLEEAVDKIKQNTRRFAKRQLTWFKRQDDIKWFEPGETEKIIEFLNQSILQNRLHEG